jgi:hypothetical protein
MLTYQAKQRYYKLIDDKDFSFPNSFEAVFTLLPLQPFGCSAVGGRTAVRSVGMNTFFNANTGHHFVQSQSPILPLVVVVDESIRTVEFRGNEFVISGKVENAKELDDTISCIFFVLPILLNVEFGDPPVVDRVEGRLGEAPFRWELSNWSMEVTLTTQEEQEKKAYASWNRIDLLVQEGNRRLGAALHYFHVCCRLCRAGQFPWEFMSEAIVNLSKILEVLFPPKGDGQTMEAARAGLTGLGYSQDDVERLFMPAMMLRSNIDCAHADLSIFTSSQLRVLHTYTEAAETAFRQLLSKVLIEVETGRFKVAQHTGQGHDRKSAKTIEKMAKHFGER